MRLQAVLPVAWPLHIPSLDEDLETPADEAAVRFGLQLGLQVEETLQALGGNLLGHG